MIKLESALIQQESDADKKMFNGCTNVECPVDFTTDEILPSECLLCGQVFLPLKPIVETPIGKDAVNMAL